MGIVVVVAAAAAGSGTHRSARFPGPTRSPDSFTIQPAGFYEAIRGSRRIANRYARPVIRWSISVRVADGAIAQISFAPSIDSQGGARSTLMRSPSTT